MGGMNSTGSLAGAGDGVGRAGIVVAELDGAGEPVAVTLLAVDVERRGARTVCVTTAAVGGSAGTIGGTGAGSTGAGTMGSAGTGTGRTGAAGAGAFCLRA